MNTTKAYKSTLLSVEALGVLRQARASIADADWWASGVHCYDNSGTPVTFDNPMTARFTLSGAILRFSGGEGVVSSYIFGKLYEAAGGVSSLLSVTEHDKVLRLLDGVIERVERQVAENALRYGDGGAL